MQQIKVFSVIALAGISLAVLIGPAAAAAAKFTAGKIGAKVSQTTLKAHVFTVTGTEVECSEIAFSGSTEALEKETQRVQPTYKGCTAFGFANAAVNTTGCSYTLSAAGSVNLTGCTAGGITITVNVPFIAKCIVEVPNQNGINGITYFNTPHPVHVAVAATNIAGEVKESTGACPLTVGKHTNLAYTAESVIEAEGTTIQWDK